MTKAPERKTRSARPGRGTLLVISALLVGSAILRLGTDAGQAFAKQNEQVEATSLTPLHETNAQSCTPPPELAPTLAAFQEREARLKQSEAKLRARVQALAVADQEIERKLVQLTKAEDELRKTLALADSAAENDLARLTTVYENMKPKDAALLFETMEPGFSAGFLGRMRPDAAAGIMTGLSPQTAYSISAILAGRNASVPTE